MRKWLALLCFLTSFPILAAVNVEPLLDRIVLQLSAEQWVTTKTALVTIGINASINDSDLGKVQSGILGKLHQLAGKDEWHIISFDRSEDQSGLEKIHITAQARLSEDALAGIRDKAKALSKPGETFTLDDLQFTASDEELRKANTALRNNIYQQVQTELDVLNKQYPTQKYYLHQINFMNEQVGIPQAMQQNVMMNAKLSGNTTNNLSVGDKLKVTATVILATAPNEDVVKMVNN